ncbi:hypothetical protein IM697_38845 [Streptomyces ferrugineus]|uniref:Uncharacterized protein n=1 Tax=Streptomyces ferrugineus TaxID=1413221 RepID=A0A7M2SI15_9ACTN|nr:hypothetical protein [Streptomyces ferrugineus]QOV35934.1 hypothetical protein IM697_38845 [Streptomyces ferrugineus]
MPVEHDEDHFQDHFEGRLGHALHNVGDRFDADRAALAAAGQARGRRLRLRRRAAMAGGAAGIALVGVGGALLVPWGGTSGTSVAQQPSATHAPAPVTGDQLISALEELLPPGKVSEQAAQGSTEDAMVPPFARLVYDDGKGAAAIAVSMERVRPGSESAREWTNCPDKALVPYDNCEVERTSDGSVIMNFQGYAYPDRRVDTKHWYASLLTAEGHHVTISEWNAAAEKDASITREEPPLRPELMKAIITKGPWRDAIDAIAEDPKAPTAAPSDAPAEPTTKAILDTLVPLLPKDAEVVEQGRDHSYVVLDDGKGLSYAQINVQHGMDDVADELFGDDSETLPDGTRVRFRDSDGDKGVAGSVMWTVDTLRTDGFRVVVSACNAGTQRDAPTREKPALSEKQLREIALSPQWDRFR